MFVCFFNYLLAFLSGIPLSIKLGYRREIREDIFGLETGVSEVCLLRLQALHHHHHHHVVPLARISLTLLSPLLPIVHRLW